MSQKNCGNAEKAGYSQKAIELYTFKTKQRKESIKRKGGEVLA